MTFHTCSFSGNTSRSLEKKRNYLPIHEVNLSKFRGSLGDYEVQETSDGSATVFSKFFNEACHSHHGAETETRYIYVDGCEVVSRKCKTIFEVGFGVGTGWAETIKVHDNFLFYSTELDEDLVYWAQENNKLFDSLEKEGDVLIGKKKNATCIILLGDARKTVSSYKFKDPFNAIYQDAFSPKRNPTLWTQEWFELLLKLSDKDAILSTYSASSRVKKALFVAGWKIEERKGFAAKRSSTRAFREGEIDAQLIEKISNPKIEPLTDSSI